MDIEQMQKDVMINETDLNKELTMQSASYIQVAQAYVKADADYGIAKEAFEIWMAKKDAEVRADFEEQKKKATEKLIESTIKQLEEYKNERRSVLMAKTKMESLKAMKESWWMRKDCLIQLCIKQRAEMEQTNMTIKQSDAVFN